MDPGLFDDESWTGFVLEGGAFWFVCLFVWGGANKNPNQINRESRIDIRSQALAPPSYDLSIDPSLHLACLLACLP